MTISDMHLAFKFGMDKLDDLNLPVFEHEEIDLLLNKAQDRYIKQKYGYTNMRRVSFEEIQKRTEDLKVIISNQVLTPIANAPDNIDLNANFVVLPADHWFIIQERANITYTDCHGNAVQTIAEVKPVQHIEVNKTLRDPFKKPRETKILRLMEAGRVELIHAPNQVINTYSLRYLRKPLQVLFPTVSCELSDHTHQELVDFAISLALEGIEARRQQTFEGIKNTDE